MPPWERLLSQPAAREHMLQFATRGDERLAANIARYFADGLRTGQAGIAITSRAGCADLKRRLRAAGIDVAAAQAEGRFVTRDAARTLRSLMRDGAPDWNLFDASVGVLARRMRKRFGGLRAFGDMVGILWARGEPANAQLLEEYWNELQSSLEFSLFCSYPIEVFSRGLDVGAIEPILNTHSHLLPARPDLEEPLQRAVHEAIGVSGLQIAQRGSAAHSPSWSRLPEAEAAMLWIHANEPARAEEILTRVRAS